MTQSDALQASGVPPLQSRPWFLGNLRAAVEEQRGYAAAKLGVDTIQRLSYSVAAVRSEPDSKLLRVLEPHLVFHSLKQEGLFPPDPQFYLHFNEFYARHLRNVDCLGVFPTLLRQTQSILAHYQLDMPLVDFDVHEPDRSSPSIEDNCYLPAFRGRKLLFVCSFAGLLQERATREIFEGVWAKTGKRWFYPASVEALEFPFGYTATTHERYASSLDLFEEIAGEMGRRDFDVALIAAAGLGIPLASYAKQLGKIAIHLGGHMQVLFGVLGKRWRGRRDWQERYFNEWWIEMPDRYRPPETDIADGGAYW
jgi:hypothetical protein